MSMQRPDEQSWTIGKLLEWTTGYFRDKRLDTPRLDAEVLLAHVLDCARIDLYTLYDGEVAEIDRGKYRALVQQRAAGCPAAYLVGYREFFSLRFAVSPAVLIPRPETEHLVSEALVFARTERFDRFLDLGTGAGNIAITLTHELADAHAVAVDNSAEALALARGNAQDHGVCDRIEFLESDLFAEVSSERLFDAVISNPPYIAADELASLPIDVRQYEPMAALDGGVNGLSVISKIVQAAPAYLRPGGLLLLEIGSNQEKAVRALIDQENDLMLGLTIRDGAGYPRVIRAAKRTLQQ